MARLTDLMGDDCATGAGIFALHEERFVFVGERTQRPEGGLACIRVGGRCEPGESLAECAQREAREEIGCEITLQHSELTYVAEEDGPLTPHSLDDRPAPLLLYVRQWAEWAPLECQNAIFTARLERPPRPGPEAEMLLLLSKEALLALAEKPLPLWAVEREGAQVFSLTLPRPGTVVFAEPAARHLASLLNEGVRIE